ncbi:TRAP transporter small permease subunit [Elioraea sp.]|uniref:TRAP transporter small permease subunit n=1 Tax=Elioraea sp. TaxID=2185103 RepID=UPI0025BB6FBB|nr:TRAP transporter small permease [Elioraea sp.]
MLRRALDALYLLSGIAGAVALLAIAFLILAQIVLRQTGGVLAGGDDLTAFAMAACAMLPLAYAFRHGAHIRVDLIIGRVRGVSRTVMEAVALSLASFMALLFAWASTDLVADSIAFEEVAQGMLATPLWIPQTLMAAGAIVFAIALVDDLVVLLTGGVPSYRRQETGALEKAAEEL